MAFMPSGAPATLTIERTPGDPPVVRVEGEVDVLTAPQLRAALRSTIEESSGDILVDLGATEFMDSCGLGVLVGALRRLHDRGSSMILRGLSPTLRQLVQLTALDNLFALEEAPA